MGQPRAKTIWIGQAFLPKPPVFLQTVLYIFDCGSKSSDSYMARFAMQVKADGLVQIQLSGLWKRDNPLSWPQQSTVQSKEYMAAIKMCIHSFQSSCKQQKLLAGLVNPNGSTKLVL